MPLKVLKLIESTGVSIFNLTLRVKVKRDIWRIIRPSNIRLAIAENTLSVTWDQFVGNLYMWNKMKLYDSVNIYIYICHFYVTFFCCNDIEIKYLWKFYIKDTWKIFSHVRCIIIIWRLSWKQINKYCFNVVFLSILNKKYKS